MRKTIRAAAAAAATVALVGCLGDGPTQIAPACPQVGIPTVAGDTVSIGEDGLRYLTIQNGTGNAAVAGGGVVVHYTGYLPDGRVFDSTEGGQPAGFWLDQVIPGFRDGIVGMREGGRRMLIIPPNLAYGANPPVQSCIPVNSTLIFDVRVIQAVARN